MKNKQTIIDGVDVSKCEYYFKINKHTGQYCICELEPNCLYKQVKRLEKALKDVFVSHGKTTEILLLKEQECEELKEENKEIRKYQYEQDFLQQQLDQLKAENEECIKDNEYLKTIIKDFTQEVVKLKQTLTEIKEIAEAYGYWTPVGGYKQILQKISEVENDNTGNI